MRLINTDYKSCKECTPETGRYPGCHSTCEKYKQAHAEHMEMRDRFVREHKNEAYFVERIMRGRDRR